MSEKNPKTGELAFTPEREEKFRQILAKYETKRSALLPVLYLAQDQFGFISPDVMALVGKKLEIPTAHVYEAVSFYSMFKKKDMGRYCLQVCNNITCTMMGSESLISAIHDELGIKLNELTADKMFSVIPVQCLGSCDTAPVVQVNDEYFEKLNPDQLKELLRKLKRGEQVMPAEASP